VYDTDIPLHNVYVNLHLRNSTNTTVILIYLKLKLVYYLHIFTIWYLCVYMQCISIYVGKVLLLCACINVNIIF